MVQSYLMNPEVEKAVRRVHDIFRSKEITLSLAESCTGGLISHYLTCLSGASTFFAAGVVAYAGEAKKSILGVPPSVMAEYGLVSERTACEMAERMRLLTASDYSLSTTGILEPELPGAIEQGRVFIAVNREGRTFVRDLYLSSDRRENKREAALSALRFLVECAEDHEEDSS